ncbi:NfeD family protein [Salidesulfovibrio onnuriiensis]|uniref:NfeD family protein n=1 Tax=Salidesulfovibrio onnuriiensis TaxID=2583823 RepID=UPI0011C9BFCC|nr:nodulation protein NfeD [Salidesulfovibrio onnuriiensis]
MARLTLVLFALLLVLPLSAQAAPFRVLRVDLDAAISPAQEEMFGAALNECLDRKCDMLLLVLDTPGGLGESMRRMVKAMLNSRVPVGVWVGPSGARAASAGVFLVAASSVAGMAPQTTIGAASPVNLGGKDMDETMARKVQNDFMSLVRGVAEAKGRNAAWYAEAVEKSVSITAHEALKARVVEIAAGTPEEFVAGAGERGIPFKDGTVVFSRDDIRLESHDPGFRYRLLSWLMHPQIAYLLLLGGMLGLFIEITHPGTVFPGVFGGICLLVSMYALSVLPTNIAGILLILFGLVLFGLEIKIVSYGLLSVGGVSCLFFGTVILFRDEFGYLPIPLSAIFGPLIFFTVVVGFVVYLVAKAQRKKQASGMVSMIGLTGRVRHWSGKTGTILVRGEIWAAKVLQSDFTPLVEQEVKVVGISGLTLDIEPCNQEPLADKG